MRDHQALADVPERIAEELAEVLEIRDPRKATRNVAVVGLILGSLAASGLAQAAGVVDLFNPVVTLALFAMLTLALPHAWRAKEVDVRLALKLFEVHRRVRGGRFARAVHKRQPLYFRLRIPTAITPWDTAKMAFEPYSLALSIGAITWSAAIGIAPGSDPLSVSSAALALSVALLSMGSIVVATWIVPPLWLLKAAGLRVLDPHEGEVARVDAWFNSVLGPLMGVAALGTLFIVFAIGGIGLRPALYSFVSISIALFPISFAATYLYRTGREAKAAAALAVRVRGLGVPSYRSLTEAMNVYTRPKD